MVPETERVWHILYGYVHKRNKNAFYLKAKLKSNNNYLQSEIMLLVYIHQQNFLESRNLGFDEVFFLQNILI